MFLERFRNVFQAIVNKKISKNAPKYAPKNVQNLGPEVGRKPGPSFVII